MTRQPARVRLTAISNADTAKLDRTTVRWQRDNLDQTLATLWQGKGGLRMAYNVYTARMIGALRRRFDRRGYSLRSQTELHDGTVVLWITQRYRGHRPERAHSS